jgi:phytanoyl-CoA hydroxylase
MKAETSDRREGESPLPEEINRSLYRYDHLADYTDSIQDVGERQARFYNQEGYLAVQHVFDSREVGEALEALMNIVLLRSRVSPEQFELEYAKKAAPPSNNKSFNETTGESLIKTDAEGQIVKKRPKSPSVQVSKPRDQLHTPEERELATRKVWNFVDFEPKLRDMALHPKLLQVVELLLGAKPLLVDDAALLKPPHSGQEKPWHQDMAYRGLDYDRRIIGVWIALDEADAENGCMHVIPRSHMNGGTPHYSVRDWQICDANVNVDQDVIVPLKPGGVLFFHGMTHHGTPNNFSDKRRRALQFHYAPMGAKLMTPQEYRRMFTNEISNAQC